MGGARRTAALIVGLLALAGAATASAALRHGGTRVDVYVVDIRTGVVSPMTANPESPEDKLAYSPSWSPDARRLVYAETRCHGCNSEIRVTPTRVRPVPLGKRIGFGFHPRWSPTGSTIAFVDTAGSIETMRDDGSGRRVVARGGLANDDPAWSPDGRTLAFSRQLDAASWSIYLVGAKGGATRPLLRGAGQAVNPAWSPDGRQIVFALRGGNGRWQIAVVRRNGTHLRRLSDGTASDSSPTWSPDGRQIVFVREQGIDGSALYVVSAHGGRAKRLTPKSLAAVQPQWSPRGTFVAFSARVLHSD